MLDHRDLRICISVGLACLLIYNLNLRSISAGDTYPARYLPFSIWRYGTLVLDPIANTVAQGRSSTAYWIVPARGHQISLYPVVLPVLVAPLYLPAVLYLQFRGWDERLDRAARVMEKLTASLLAAAATALFYLVMRRRAPPGTSLVLALVFGLGTTTWVISSQALWQHGVAELLLVLEMLLLTGAPTPLRVLTAGLICGLIAGNRPPDSILAAALGLYGVWWAGRRAALLVATALVPVALVAFYNVHVAGTLLGGYGIPDRGDFIHHGLFSGMLGLLFSPTRGLFVFSPFLLFLFYRPSRLLGGTTYRPLTMAMGVAIALQVLLYAKADWRGGYSFGPRWLTDVLPFLIWMLPPVVAALGTWGRLLFGLACAVAVAIEAIGAFFYAGASDRAVFAESEVTGAPIGAWDPRNAPFLAELRHRRAPPELIIGIRGAFDRIASGDREVRGIDAGQEIVAEGWALAGGHTPHEIVFLLDGRWAGGTTSFFARPDVERALGEESPAGWRFPLPTDGLTPGKHVLGGFVRAYEVGELHLLGERAFVVGANGPQGSAAGAAPAATGLANYDLARSARDAAAAVAVLQQPRGFWLTAYTSKPRFEDPRLEMNTFLTAMMVDVLDPVAGVTGLRMAVQRAREHLAGQIEATGLVRYHGRPDGPTIGTLGCVITPDADDTALVWRIAPGASQELRKTALTTLGRYRTENGLYRTWLAEQDRFECIDPGKDPNPPDVGIQMNVFLWIAKEDPSSGHALCEALRRAVSQESAWVYYRNAPLIPIFRQAALQAAGCGIHVPEAMMRAANPDQEAWIDAARLLNRLETPGERPPDAAEILRLLRSIASQDFAALKRSPPLLYHNDVTASTPRFYWSDAFGYALWLRIFHEYSRKD